MKRSNSRIKALMVLYSEDLMKNPADEENLDKLFNEVDDNFSYDISYFEKIVNGVRENLYSLDKIISICLKNYTIDRLSYVDRNLIRIGTFELKYTNTPKSVIINEIVNLSHEYSEIENYETSKFNNSLLERISKRIEDGK